MELTKRQKNLIRRFCNGELFYHSHSPKITQKEVKELWDLGFILQTEWPLHEPAMVYPLRKKEFVELAIKFGVVS